MGLILRRVYAKSPNVVIMFSEDSDFTPIFYRQYLKLIESFSEHCGFWYLKLRYQVYITMDMH